MRTPSGFNWMCRRPALRPPAILVMAAMAATATLPQAPARAQDGKGIFVPVVTSADELPANLPASNIFYTLKLLPDLPPTDDNVQSLKDQLFQIGLMFSTGTVDGVKFPSDDGKDPALTQHGSRPIAASVGVQTDWQDSVRLPPANLLATLRNSPTAILGTSDAFLRITRPAQNQVQLVVPIHGPGRRFEFQPGLAAMLQRFGRKFEVLSGGEITETEVADPNGGPPRKVQVVAPGLLRLTLTDAQAMEYLAALGAMPKEFDAEIRPVTYRIVLAFPIPIAPELARAGPALLIRMLRITSQPAPGKKSVTIPFHRIEIDLVRVKPDPKTFASLLKADMWDPEIMDRYNRCPSNAIVTSRFSTRLPQSTAIPAGKFDDLTGTPMCSETESGPGRNSWILQSYEDTLDVAIDPANPGRMKFNGLLNAPIGGNGLLIGHYYYLFDATGTSFVPANAGGVKPKFSVTRSEYSNIMHSSTTTSGVEVEISAKGGLKDILEIGGSSKFSLSQTDTTGGEQGRGISKTNEVEVELPRVFNPGSLTIVDYPVVITGTTWGSPEFTFASEEKLSFGGSARILEYVVQDGTLRRVISNTDPNDVTKRTFKAGDAIAGVHLNLVKALYPDLIAAAAKADVFAGRWRSTDLSDGSVDYLTVDAAGLVTTHGDPKPSRKLAKNGDGRATMTTLDDNQALALAYEVMKSGATGMLGSDSKIVFKQNGSPVEFWIKVGDD